MLVRKQTPTPPETISRTFRKCPADLGYRRPSYRLGAQTLQVSCRNATPYLAGADVSPFGHYGAGRNDGAVLNRHPRHDTAPIGTIGQVMPRRTTFAKGSYYVEFAANQDNEEALAAFAKALEPKVPGSTDTPAALTWFPDEGLDAASVRLVPQSVMGLRMLKRGYLAKYEDGRAFIVAEESADAAAAVLAQFKERLSDPVAGDVADASITGKDRYLGQMYVAQKGRHLIGFATRNADADLAGRVGAIAALVE